MKERLVFLDLNPCYQQTPCQNNGVCSPGSNGAYTCYCNSPYTGTHCETRISRIQLLYWFQWEKHFCFLFYFQRFVQVRHAEMVVHAMLWIIILISIVNVQVDTLVPDVVNSTFDYEIKLILTYESIEIYNYCASSPCRNGGT